MKTEWKIGIFYIIAVISIFLYDAFTGAFGGVSDSQIYADIVQFSLIYFLIWLVYSSFADQLTLKIGQKYRWLNILNISKLIVISFFALLWILNLNGFFAQDEMKILKKELIESVFDRQRSFKEKEQISNGKTPDEAKAYVASLEPIFQKEKEKFYRYCDGKNSTLYCKINYKWPEYMEITYRYDKESYAFFNQPVRVSYVDGPDYSTGACINFAKPVHENNESKTFYKLFDTGYRLTVDYSQSRHHNVEDTDGQFNEIECRYPVPKESIIDFFHSQNIYIQKQN